MNTTTTGDRINHFGITIPIDRSILSWNLVTSIVKGSYEHQEAIQLAKIIQPGERILEIGAGLGFMSALAAKNPFTSAVRVFEANPNLIPYIQNLHAINGVTNVEINSGVLTNDSSAKSMPFYLRKDFWASSLSEKPFGYREVVQVPCHNLNKELATYKPTLIICDIEGGELDLFRKAKLDSVMKIYVEVHQKVIGRHGMLELFANFSKNGFAYDQNHSSGGVILFSRTNRPNGPYPGFSPTGQPL